MLRAVLMTAALLAPEAGSAAAFAVSPVRLFLSPQRANGRLRVENQTEVAVPMQVTIVRWTQDVRGRDVETPATDVLFFPKLLTLPARGVGTIRVARRNPDPDTIERAYRVYLRQLPGTDSSAGSGLAMMLRVGVPLFFAPKQTEQSATLAAGTLRHCAADFSFTNTGTVHLQLQSAQSRALDAHGDVAQKNELTAWYVLAGATRENRVEVAAAACEKTSTVELEITTEDERWRAAAHVDR